MSNRRDFLKAMIALPWLLRPGRHFGPELTIGLFYSNADSDEVRGARMSAGEAKRAAELLGGSLMLKEFALPMGASDIDDIQAAIIVLDASAARALLPALLGRNLPVINASVDPAELTDKSDPRVFHVVHSGCALWNATLEQFGAAQLNDRFRAAYSAPMSSAAWAGWFAVKVLWESATRVGGGEPSRLLEFLQSPRAAFDGHRGRLLHFDQLTHIVDAPCLAA